MRIVIEKRKFIEDAANWFDFVLVVAGLVDMFIILPLSKGQDQQSIVMLRPLALPIHHVDHSSFQNVSSESEAVLGEETVEPRFQGMVRALKSLRAIRLVRTFRRDVKIMRSAMCPDDPSCIVSQG